MPDKVFLELESLRENYADIVKYKYENRSGKTLKKILDDDLIPWGHSTIGGYFFWKFDAIKPYVVSYDLRGVGREEYPNYSLTEFIYGLLTRTVSCEAASDYDIEDRVLLQL
jgi:hypothetical protein